VVFKAIPQGQYEAARSIGLSYWQMNMKVVLPQAIRISIPSIVNTSIGLFKDTTLSNYSWFVRLCLVLEEGL
jgi:general L-amino acid transport system permease protein